MTSSPPVGRWWLIPVLLGNWALLMIGLSGQSMWVDEWFTASHIAQAWPALLPHIADTERRPPLYWAALKLWDSPVGQSEFGLRLFSCLCLPVAIALTYALGRQFAGTRAVSSGAALFVAASPFLILYGRMLRSYSLFVLLTAALTVAVVRLRQRVTARRWLTYVALAAALLYTDYGALPVLGLHAIWLIGDLAWRGRWRGVLIRLSALAAAGAAFLPWSGLILPQSQRTVQAADLAGGWLGLALKLAFPFTALSIGETLYPWNPIGLLAILTCLGLVAASLVALRRRSMTWLLAGWLVLPILFTASVLSTVARDITFLNMLSRAPHIVAPFGLLVAGGLGQLPRRRWRAAGTVVIVAAVAWSLLNYYAGREFLNPIYTLPTRAIARQVSEQSTPDDLIIADADTVFGYYYQRQPGPARYANTDYSSNLPLIEALQPRRIWLLTFGRDRTAGLGQADELAAWLADRYRITDQAGYGEVGPDYRWVKERLIGRPVYVYKLTLTRYER